MSFFFYTKFQNIPPSPNASDKKMYLNCYNLENSEWDEINFSIECKACYPIILCEQKRDDNTKFLTFIIIITKLSSRRLRFLQTNGNNIY